MKNQHFDLWEFHNITSLIENNPLEAKIRFENYLNKYKNDYSAYSIYTYVLIILGYFEEAETIINYVNDSYLLEQSYPDKRKELTKKDIIFNTFKLLFYQNRFEELYQYIQEHRNDVETLKLGPIEYLCNKYFDLPLPDYKEKNSYLFTQLANYSEEAFLEHIKKHQEEYNQNIEEPNNCIFSSDFPIKTIYEEIKKNLATYPMIHPGFFEDAYIFKYDNCGRVNNKVVNHFKLVAVHGTNNFITMCPIENGKYLPQTDLNYLYQEKNKPKTKTLSQIDKFNKRYNHNN